MRGDRILVNVLPLILIGGIVEDAHFGKALLPDRSPKFQLLARAIRKKAV